MNLIDPESPKQQGTDIEGKRRELGDTDSMGHFIGWIDESGDCWESCRERDCTITAGCFRDQMSQWNRSGGLLGMKPDARLIAESMCLNPDSIEEAIREAESWFDPEDSFAAYVMARQAQQAAAAAVNN